MLKILIIGGFAQSGKSSLVNGLKHRLDCPVYSGSISLHQIRRSLINSLGLTLDDGSLEGVRKTNITIAEDILVPALTRDVFGFGLVSRLMKDSVDSKEPIKHAIIESIGGEEYRSIRNALDYYQNLGYLFQWQAVNIRRVSEQAGVDIRELIPFCNDIINDGTVVQLIEAALKEFNIE